MDEGLMHFYLLAHRWLHLQCLNGHLQAALAGNSSPTNGSLYESLFQKLENAQMNWSNAHAREIALLALVERTALNAHCCANVTVQNKSSLRTCLGLIPLNIEEYFCFSVSLIATINTAIEELELKDFSTKFEIR